MNTSNIIAKNISSISNKETKITALTLLKNFYDEQIFGLLIREFYNSDLDISVAAVKASASLGNETAIPHLYRILEQGKPVQKIAAIQTLATINAPSSIENLVKYFTIFPDREVRRELLRAITAISPLNARTRELTRSLLLDAALGKDYYEIILPALLEAGELELVQNHLLRASPNTQRASFNRLLQASSQEVSSFIEHFQDHVRQFDPHTLGCYLAAYELKLAAPQANFVIDTLQSADPRATASFMISLADYRGRIERPQGLFRLLLKLPFIDLDTEAMTGDFLIKIMEEVKRDSPLLLNEFLFSTATNLEAVYAKLKNQYISLKGIKEKDALLAVLLAKIMEQYSNTELLQEAQAFFRTDTTGNPAALVNRIRERMISAPEDDQNHFKACVHLFTSTQRMTRLGVYQALAKANLGTPALLRRLNRLVRIVGTLEVRNSGKKILEIMGFARDERIHFLEETCVVTLCQLLNRTAIEQAKIVFSEPGRYPDSLKGYIRGARFVPVKIFLNPLLKLVLSPKLPARIRLLVVDSLKKMNLSGMRGVLPPLVRALKLKEIENPLKEDLAEILSAYGDATVFQLLLDLAGNPDGWVRRLSIRTIRKLASRETSLPLDVLTNRLYQLLEDRVKGVRVDTLLTLLSLGDDYAVQILDDYIGGKDEEAVGEILAHLDFNVSHELMTRLLKLIRTDNLKIQEELRRALPVFCQGPLAEVIRNTLVEALKEEDGGAGVKSAAAQPLSDHGAGLIGHAKLEFKFRRENAQILTVFFTDIVKFTEKSSATDPFSLIKLIQAFEKITLPTIENLKGTLIKKMGDGLLAVFKHPLNATIAALEIQRKIREYNQFRMEGERFDVRVGLNTGMVIRKDGDIFGDTVNVASRMETSATPGDILLTQSTYEEIKDFIRCTRLGDLLVKGKAEAIPTYSAEEILIDIDHIMSEGTDSRTSARPGQEAGSLLNLKESMFTPRFAAPAHMELSRKFLDNLENLFEDINNALEDVAKDYHEEYIFKRYLQDKWNEIMAAARSETAAKPPNKQANSTV